MNKHQRYVFRKVARGLCARCTRRREHYAYHCDACQIWHRHHTKKARNYPWKNAQRAASTYAQRDPDYVLTGERKCLRTAKRALLEIKRILRSPSRSDRNPRRFPISLLVRPMRSQCVRNAPAVRRQCVGISPPLS